MGTHPIFESDFDCLTDHVATSIAISVDDITEGVNGPTDKAKLSIIIGDIVNNETNEGFSIRIAVDECYDECQLFKRNNIDKEK